MKKHALQMYQSFKDPERIDYWDSVYEQQDFFGDIYRQRMDIALSWLNNFGLSENSKILDAGCGAGRLVNEAAKLRFNVTGMDYSYGMLVKATEISKCKREENPTFCQGSIEQLPIKNSSLDAIVALGVVDFLQSTDKTIREAARVLRTGGVLVFSFCNKARMVGHLDLPLIIRSIILRISRMVKPPSKMRGYEEDRIRLNTYLIPNVCKALELEGFSVLEYTTVPLELFTFFGREVFPREISLKITRFFERFSNIPVVGSFGGTCVLKAMKKTSTNN